ncbi:MAG: hypothetical protein IPG63_17985 [Xanthomonadales bacterium]|nr:hypothetical protein [Xanthomonadales bacterium]
MTSTEWQDDMKLGQFLARLPQLHTRTEALSQLAAVARGQLDADTAMVAMYERSSGKWTGYVPDGERPLSHKQISLFGSVTLLERVRQQNKVLFEVVRLTGQSSESVVRNDIRHAVGIPIQRLDLIGESEGFMGAIHADRRGSRDAFDPVRLEAFRLVSLAATAALSCIEAREAPSPQARTSHLWLRTRDALWATAGNVVKAQRLLGDVFPTRGSLTSFIHAAGMRPLQSQARAMRDPEGIIELIRELRDLREVARRLGKTCKALDRHVRAREVRGGLKALVETAGFTWSEVHGEAFTALVQSTK